MAVLTERIVKLLGQKAGLTDRELTDILNGHSAYQKPIKVQQICRRLSTSGVLERRRRVDGKIGNYLIDSIALEEQEEQQSLYEIKQMPEASKLEETKNLATNPTEQKIERSQSTEGVLLPTDANQVLLEHRRIGQGPLHSRSLSRRRKNAPLYISIFLSILSLVVSILVAEIAYLDYIQPGDVRPFPPSGYAIIRGDGSFPSDYLVLPLEWENTSGKSVLIRKPELILHEIDDANNETGTKYRFLLAGEYPEISYTAIQLPYAYKYSFSIEEHSTIPKVLVFHYERWWDENNSLYKFQFKSGQKYRVDIKFYVDNKQKQEQGLFIMPIYGRADELVTDRAKSYWDFWYLDYPDP